jgi:hypothetical protein
MSQHCVWCGWRIPTPRPSGMHPHCEENRQKMLEKAEEEGR